MEFISERVFGKYSKMKILGLKWSNFEAFLRHSTLKTGNFFKKNVMVAYVHIVYYTCQFSEESKGGGWNPPTPDLAVPKKAWSC